MKQKSISADRYAGLVRPLTSLAALAGLVAAFVGLFPSQQRLSALSRQRESDALSIAYMQLLLRTHPEDDALRCAVAHNLASAGKWEQARSTLHPMMAEAGESGQRMRMEALEIELFILQQTPPSSPQRAVVKGRIAAQIEALRREPLKQPALERLAAISLAVTLPGPAAQIYHQLAATDAAQRQHWLELAATQYLASNAPERAAPVYEEAALNAVSDAPSQRKYTLLALDAYLAANQGGRALALVNTAAPRFVGDAQFLRRAVAVAVSQNDSVTARRLGRQLVALLPDDTQALAGQFDREAAAKDSQAALQLASRLVALEPAESTHHARLARAAEWAGKPGIALEQWRLLARDASDSEAMDNALRLALDTGNDSLWLALASQALEKRPLKPNESAALAVIQSRSAAPGPVIAFFTEYRKRHALQPMEGEVLAGALERQGDVSAALAVWQTMNPRLISPLELAHRQARLLARLKRLDQAWALLQQVRAQAKPADTAYWQAVGDVAWARDSRADALQAYRTVWQAGSFNAVAMERLIELHNASEQPQEAIAIGTQAYERLADARWLLLAMDAASQASAWEDLRRLAHLAKTDEKKFAKSEMYWQLQAQLASHDASVPQARAAYRRALALNPASVPSRVQLLWLEIDGGNASQLDSYLRQWQADAQTQPAYWPVYAMALLQLKKPDEALVWFERQQAGTKPQDDLLSLSYAQALEQAGQTEAARRQRSALLPRLKTRLGAADSKNASGQDGKGSKGDKGLLLAYASLVREFDGPAASDQVLAQMLGRGHDGADVYQLLVASSLSQEKFDQAHNWLQRAKAAHRQLPAYQPLAVALAQNDRPALEEILQSRGNELSPPDQVAALRQLGHRLLALSLTEKSLLDAEADTESAQRLRQHRDQLRTQLASHIEAGYEARNLSDLKIGHTEASASFGFDAGRATVRLAHNDLRTDSGPLKAADGLSENDVSAQAEVSVGGDPLRLTVGRNQRTDTSLNYGRVEWTRALSPRLSAKLNLSVNALTEETSALRAFGSKDKAALSLSASPSEATYARMELAGQRFNTRSGDTLGNGWRLEGEAGVTLLKSNPAWRLRLSGSTEENRLADQLPPALAASLQLPPSSVQSVLSPRFSTLGVGATYRYGQPGGAQGTLDGWVGRQWPANERAYSLRAGVSVPVKRAGQIRLEGFYTNVQGGVSTQANRGLGVWYRHEF